MKQPDIDVVRGLAHIAQNVPAVAEWLTEQQLLELKRLPATTANVAIAQGRCQVLGELIDLLETAPSIAAESRNG